MSPPLAWRAVLLGMPSRCTGNVEKIIPLDVGICVILRMSGYRQFVIGAHLPHRQREDCLSCWQGFIHQLETILRGRRYHDVVVLTVDTNYELASTDRADEREVCAKLLLRNFGLTHTNPATYTWSNTRGSYSKIDYILLSSPDNVIASQDVLTDSDFLLGADHRAVMASFPVSREPRHHFRPPRKPKNPTSVVSGLSIPVASSKQPKIFATNLTLAPVTSPMTTLPSLLTLLPAVPQAIGTETPRNP